MKLVPGTKFGVANPYVGDPKVSTYEVVRVNGKTCLCYDTSTRHYLNVPTAFVRSKIGNTKQKDKS